MLTVKPGAPRARDDDRAVPEDALPGRPHMSEGPFDLSAFVLDVVDAVLQFTDP